MAWTWNGPYTGKTGKGRYDSTIGAFNGVLIVLTAGDPVYLGKDTAWAGGAGGVNYYYGPWAYVACKSRSLTSALRFHPVHWAAEELLLPYPALGDAVFYDILPALTAELYLGVWA